MTTVDWLIWIFFGLPGLAIWKCDAVVNVITTIGTIMLLPLIEYEIVEIYGMLRND